MDKALPPQGKPDARELFERMNVPKALMRMALPAIASQLITLVYNIADTWFIGRTDDPYMVAASSLVLTVFLMLTTLATLFGTGGGTIMVQLLGKRADGEAKDVAAWSLIMSGAAALTFSLLCLVFMDPLLYLLGASENTIDYARQYLLFVVVIGGLPSVLSQTMSNMVRNAGYSKQAGWGLSMGGVLNVALDPLFMFVLLPKGSEVMGAAIATMLSNVVALVYFVLVYRKLRHESVIELPKRLPRIRRETVKAVFAVGFPAAASILLYDLTNVVINRLASADSDIALAAIGIVLKVERLPLNICVGICLGMSPLIAYNYAARNAARMKAFFSKARLYGLAVSAVCVVLYRLLAPVIMRAFIADAGTVELGTEFLKVRCFAPPFMFLSFQMVHYMQSVKRGSVAFSLAVIRQICLNIPILLLFSHLFGVMGIVMTQAVADCLTAAISYVIYHFVTKKMMAEGEWITAK